MTRIHRIGLLGAIAALTLQLGCDSPTGSGSSGPTAVALTSGEGQTAVAGSELPQPLVVRVTDDDGDPVAGVAVSFTAAGGGSVAPAAATTDAQGQASTRWTLGPSTADSQTVTVQARNAAGAVAATVVAHATAQAGAPAAVAPNGNSTFTGTAGLALLDSVAVRVTDAHGNPVPGTAVVWTVISGGGSVSPATATTNAAGVAKAAWTLGPRVDSAQVLDAAAGLTLHTKFMAMANTGATAYTEKTSGDAQTDTAGQTLPQPLVVTVRLSDGRPVRGATVTWTAGAGTVSAPTSITDSLGRASVTWKLANAAGAQTVTATAAGLPVTFNATALPAPLGGLIAVSMDRFAGSPGEVRGPLVVKASDVNGNPMAGVSVSWAVTAGGGSVTPASSVTDASGLAQATWTLGGGPYPQKVTASAPGVDPVTFTADSTTVSLGQVSPADGAAVGDAFGVTAYAGGTTGVPRVVAWVGDRSVELVRGRVTPYHAGVLDITGLPVGTHTLVVAAIGPYGDTARVTRSIYHEPAPVLQVSVPSGTVVRTGSVQLDVSCTGITPCDSIVVYAGTSSVAHGSGSLSASVSLAAFEGRTVVLEVEGYGPHGIGAQVKRTVFVESTPHWTELASAGTRMQDIDATRVLYVDSADAAGPAVKVRARAGGAETAIYRIPNTREPSGPVGGPVGYLHSQGAIFRSITGPSTNSGSEILLDWRGGTPVTLGTGIDALYLNVTGDWAAFGGAGPTLRFRSLAAGTQQDLGGNQSVFYDVAANGDLVWMTTVGDQRVFRLRGGTNTTVSPPADSGAGPVTDGMIVAYGDCSATCRVAVVAADGSVSYPAPALRRPVRSNVVLTVEGGWVAWIDAQSTPSIWTRAPDGTVRQVRTGPTVITLLTPAGDVFYTQGDRWYVAKAPYITTPVDVGAALGRLVYRPGIGVVALVGRSAFRVDY